MERTARSHFCAGSFFALASLVGLAAFPFAVGCCSRFSFEQEKFRWGMRFDPHVGWFARTLLNWPMGFRLLVMATATAIVCSIATALLFLLKRRFERRTDARIGRVAKLSSLAARAAIASFVVGVLYILAVYVTGYFGYEGSLNLLWLLGIPALIALLEYPRPIGILLGIPLMFTGFVCTGLISILAGSGLD